MKSHFKNIFLFVLLLFCSTISLAQSVFEGNLQKYWYYRERLKNFVVVGDGVGCSNISNSYDPSGVMNYNDHTQVLGNYIGMLAMEHYLLRTNGQDLTENTKELFYAIEAINRLDKMAETYWCSPKFGGSGGPWNLTNYSPNTTQDLNGFFIRDETPYNLLDYNYNGMLMENHLGNHWAPFKDGLRKTRMGGAFTTREYYTTTWIVPRETIGGPTEMSLDQVIELTGGMILVAKFVDPSLLYVGHSFSDGESNFKQEVKNIAHRISEKCKASNWTIKNPVTGQCVKALDYLGNSCQDGGAKFSLLSFGYASANAMIEDDFQSNGNYWNTNYASQVNNANLWFPGNGLFYNAAPPLNPYEDTKVLMLAAMSNVWGPLTLNKVTDRCYKVYDESTVNFPHYPLLNCVLYNKQSILPNATYECMLNSADPEGQTNYRFNYEWNDQRLLYGANKEHNNYSSERWGEYMYYFNMYCIYNPTYMQNSYRKIPPNELAELNIVKTGTGILDANTGNYKENNEWDWKKFDAVNKISAGNINNQGNYIIKKYDGGTITGKENCDSKIIGNYVPFQTSSIWQGNSGYQFYEQFCNYDQIEQTDETKVTFVAGNQIELLPGFEVHVGAELDAYTLPNLLEYKPNQLEACVPCSNCKIAGDELVTGTNSDISDNKFYKVYSFVPGELLVVTPHVIFKVKEDGVIGENMFGINIDGSHNCPAEYKISGMNTLIGYQRFKDPSFNNRGIVDVEYYKGYTFIFFADGRTLRIKGTGGIGKDMFGVTDDNFNADFQLISGAANYEQAWYRFKKDIFEAIVADNHLLIAFSYSSATENGRIYKFNTVGSTSLVNGIKYNFWNVNESNLNTIYGSSFFKGKITCMRYFNDELLVATKNNGTAKGKLLKIRKTGGTGENMFAVNEFGNGSTFAFEGLFGYNYYLGDERFGGNTGSNPGSYITEIFNVNNETFVGLKNGKVFRVSGTGGTGHHMFNIDEYNTGFVNHSNSSTQYLKSFQDFSDGSGAINNKSYIRVMEIVQNRLLMGFHDGKLLKFDILSPTTYNGEIASLKGTSNFGTSVVSLSKVMHGCPGGENPDEYGVRRESDAQESEDEFCYCYNNVFIGFAGHQILGVKNTGDDVDNFYSVAWRNQQQGVQIGTSTEKEGFVSLCGKKYFVGSQNFKEVCAGARLANDSIPVKNKLIYTEEEYLAMAEGNTYDNIETISIIQSINVWPNPNDGTFKIKIESIEQNELAIRIIDVVGKTVSEMNVTPNEENEINLDLKAGIYYIVAKPNKLITKKLIIQ